jgi:putative oxygen-independent coproporphyrinogen III oxidase
MPGRPPEGEPGPADGALPAEALGELARRPFGIYVHVPFCRTRCGYCDFNTYTAAELGPGVSPDSYPEQVVAELSFARKVLGAADVPVRTVFFGGGTPTLLAPGRLAAILRAIDGEFGLARDAEITAEANPETVDERSLAKLRQAGFTRISLGMQSTVPQVLALLDRQHRPGRPERCVAWARAAGFEHVSLDLIYGTPGESLADWHRSVEAALRAGPDHLSAYALAVEEGTRLAARIRRRELPAPDDDDLAEKYQAADAALAAAGFAWYEISNWAAAPGARCRHNLLYWTGGNWWGAGPGAHSHIGGVRWWNVRHPAAYAARIGAAVSPAQARETLTAAQRRLERVMLLTRLSDGCPVTELSGAGRWAAARAMADGLTEPAPHAAGRVVLTRRGRLLADTVIRDITD